MEWPLKFEILGQCQVSRARASLMTLPHSQVPTPIFMPVGTQGTLKGVTVDQLENLGCQLMLGNTYHLGLRPVCRLLAQRYEYRMIPNKQCCAPCSQRKASWYDRVPSSSWPAEACTTSWVGTGPFLRYSLYPAFCMFLM
jgi:hypothetical protein